MTSSSTTITGSPKRSFTARATRLMARVRHLQLLTARAGRVAESARYARWAKRVRRVVGNVIAL